MEDKEYSVYRFRDPRDQEIIYIGLTSDPERRYREHTSKGGTLYALSQELATEGLQLIFEIFKKAHNIKDGLRIERESIQEYQPPLNVIHNSKFVKGQKELQKFRKNVYEAMELYKLTLNEALIWYSEFRDMWSCMGAFDDYQTIARTARVVQKRLQGEITFTESEILDIVLETMGAYEHWDLDGKLAGLRRKMGVEE